MKIGVDVSLATCKKDGYLIMEFKKRELVVKGKLATNVHVRFFAHIPDYCLEEKYGTANPVGVSTIITDVIYSANDVWELYQQHKKDAQTKK